MEYPNGDVYSGQWKGGLREGKGTYTYRFYIFSTHFECSFTSSPLVSECSFTSSPLVSECSLHLLHSFPSVVSHLLHSFPSVVSLGAAPPPSCPAFGERGPYYRASGWWGAALGCGGGGLRDQSPWERESGKLSTGGKVG